jgi:hypothetical protein
MPTCVGMTGERIVPLLHRPIVLFGLRSLSRHSDGISFSSGGHSQVPWIAL